MSFQLRLAGLVLGVAACGGQTALVSGGDGGATLAPGSAGAIGDPCVFAQEQSAAYAGADEGEVIIETRSPHCATGICVANHFRGRVTCPYGQDQDGKPPPGATACVTPDTGAPVRGNNPRTKATVPAQCMDRLAANTVTCSCRCANAAGRTDDGQAYCACGAGTVCAQLVTSIRSKDDDVSGAYCIKDGTAFDRATACSTTCDPALDKCP